MKTKNRKPYIVRGFDLTKEGAFDFTGRMADKKTFVELSINSLADTIVALTTHSVLHTMSARNLVITQPGTLSVPADELKEVVVIDLRFETLYSSVDDMKRFRTGIRDVLKTWAEKSRVVGRRGWRLSAIKTPTFEFDHKANCVVIRTQLVLSTAVFYSDTQVTVNTAFDYALEQEDFQSLTKALREHADSNDWLKTIFYNHSEIGKGEVLP